MAPGHRDSAQPAPAVAGTQPLPPPRTRGLGAAAGAGRIVPAGPDLEGAGAPLRVAIDAVMPEIDDGRYRAKRTTGEALEVTAHIFADGHDLIAADLLFRPSGHEDWQSVRMTELGNDEWAGLFVPKQLGVYEYTVEAWVDRFASWRADLEKRVEAGRDVDSELREGAHLVQQAADRANGDAHVALRTSAIWLADEGLPQDRRVAVATEPDLLELMDRHRDRSRVSRYRHVLELWVDRERARFGAWYEMFPRSQTADPARGASLREAAAGLPRVAAMGFDVLYLPPVHPIGHTGRKGPNNQLQGGRGDPGSPWAIGSEEGGHTAVHPELGTIEDFEWFIGQARELGLEVALDLAYQCSPDHPWVREHPQWFRHRPDGTIKYAENPPKQYQDIYPLDFETEDWRALWEELRRVACFWIDHGVRIFRVDNPHTKPFAFWEWLIAIVHAEYPDVIFLAEAFTRPKRLQGLAKLGFTQSYGYFTWRNTKYELTEYLTQLTTQPVSDYLRSNLFANTPDILHEYLQQGGRPAFLVRVALAATLGPSYGIYSGFELAEHVPAHEGSEEYLDSEKYQLRPRDWEAPGHITNAITRLNEARRAYPALQHNHRLWFLPIENDQVLAFVKADPAGGAHVLVVVNLDVRAPQGGWVGLPLAELGFAHDEPFTAHELLSGQRFAWQGEWAFVHLDPREQPAQVFAFERGVPEQAGGIGIRP
ncbi:MAG: DUF3416 domain-containing protein [Dehalococcoidia bacterium]|nr:DUF3416 domain-containing protein [Dehalococcoidia bacterium]